MPLEGMVTGISEPLACHMRSCGPITADYG
jgi:hypothetical protein